VTAPGELAAQVLELAKDMESYRDLLRGSGRIVDRREANAWDVAREALERAMLTIFCVPALRSEVCEVCEGTGKDPLDPGEPCPGCRVSPPPATTPCESSGKCDAQAEKARATHYTDYMTKAYMEVLVDFWCDKYGMADAEGEYAMVTFVEDQDADQAPAKVIPRDRLLLPGMFVDPMHRPRDHPPSGGRDPD
jgi:hypothetical protein